MTDDIVTRLRAYNIGNIGHEASSHMEETLYEAADEIDKWRNISADLYNWAIQILGDHMTIPAVQAYEKAIQIK